MLSQILNIKSAPFGSKPCPRISVVAIAAAWIFSIVAQPAALHAGDVDLGAVDITTPTGDWMEILPGESHMYEFSYDSFKEVSGELSLAKIDVEMADEGSIGFKVYSQKEIDAWHNSGNLSALGMGSVLSKVTFNDKHDKRLVWLSRAHASEYFYVVVENNRNIASYYEIEIFGSGVGLVRTEAVIAAEAAAAEAAAEEAARIAATQVVSADDLKAELAAAEPTGPLVLAAGLGPEDAMAPVVEQDILLEPGETRWFTFRYFRDAGKDATQVVALLKMPIADSVSFEIWNTDTVRKWANNEKFNPVGAGTPIGFGADFDRDPNTLVWVSSAEAGQQYYIVVKNKSAAPTSFKLNVTGPKITY